MNWETRAPEQRDLMEDDVVVGRVRRNSADDTLWCAYIADQTAFTKIGEGPLQDAQHLVAREAARRLSANLLHDSAARFGLPITRPDTPAPTPKRASGLRLIRGGADGKEPNP